MHVSDIPVVDNLITKTMECRSTDGDTGLLIVI